MTKELEFLLNIVNRVDEISKECFIVKKSWDCDIVTDLDVKIENFW